MKDVHTHVLPFVDDGSEDLSSSLAMLREMVEKGVTDVFCTPHFNKTYNADKEQVTKVFIELKEAVEKEGLPINIYLGQEIFVADKFGYKISKDTCLTLNDGKYILLEFPFDDKNEIVETVYSLYCQGFIPIIAHYERYARSSLYEASEIKSVGGLIQINASSLNMFNERRKLTLNLLREGLVDFVASDMHFSRKNCMDKAYKFVAKKFGEEYAREIFIENIDKIIKG